MGGGRTHDREVALEVNGDDRVPLLLRHVEDHPLAEDARAAHQHVEIAELAEREIDDRPAPVHRRHALRARDGLAARRADRGHDLIGRFARRVAPVDADSVVVDHHLRPGRGEAERHRPPDPRASSRHHRDLALEQSHRAPSHAAAPCCVRAHNLSRRGTRLRASRLGSVSV